MGAAAACNSANCTVVEVLKAANETYAACGIPIRDQSATLMGVTASIGSLAMLMVTLRLVDRTVSSQAQLGLDDLLIGLSAVSRRSQVTFCMAMSANLYRPLALFHWYEHARHRCSTSGLRPRHVGYRTAQHH